jgi:uncharacterized protein YceH (UPF0502 family)
VGRDRGISRPDRFCGSTVAEVRDAGTREGRFVHAFPEELSSWVGTERGKKNPVHIASESEDLVADLKQGLLYVRQQQKKRKPVYAS